MNSIAERARHAAFRNCGSKPNEVCGNEALLEECCVEIERLEEELSRREEELSRREARIAFLDKLLDRWEVECRCP